MIKLRILRWEDTVCLKILEMDEKYRYNALSIYNNEIKLYSERSKFDNYFSRIEVYSCSRPAISEMIGKGERVIKLFLRGVDKEFDDEVVCKIFQSKEAAEIFVREIEYAIQCINNKDKNTEDNDDISIVTIN